MFVYIIVNNNFCLMLNPLVLSFTSFKIYPDLLNLNITISTYFNKNSIPHRIQFQSKNNFLQILFLSITKYILNFQKKY